MTKKILTLSFWILLLWASVNAQTRMTVPHGSFEQWTSHPGYNVSLFGVSIPIFDSFATPIGWDYPDYPVNESFPVFGLTVNVNTALPLVVASQERDSVQDGSSAVKLQTFMLEDIIHANIYSIIENSLDTALTQSILPSVLSIGAINLNHFLPIMNNLLSNRDSVEALLASLAAIDINYLITGGIGLGGFEPSRLTGSYRYHSAGSGDNGGVLMLGTRYNATTHQRDLVGGGVNLMLSDITDYTPFTVDYISLHEIDSTFVEQSPDSLIILLVSSASAHMQQGSYLCLDNLVLWHDTVAIEPPDTCAIVMGLNVVNRGQETIQENFLEWQGSSQPIHWEVEFGLQGFELGQGTQAITNEPNFDIHTLELQGVLQPNTWYDLYVRSVCEGDIYGEWDSVHYRTYCASVESITLWEEDITFTADSLIAGYRVSWADTADTPEWNVSYGDPYSSDTDYISAVCVDEDVYRLPPLQPNKQYYVSVTANCGDGSYGPEKRIVFTTRPLPVGIADTDSPSLSVYPIPASGSCEVTLATGIFAELKLFHLDGRLVQTVKYCGSPVTLQLPDQGIYLLQAIMADNIVTRKIINK